ncbi:MAG TPA: hypothetical protein VFO65_04710 [Acidimicrobiales bacterium]|nr:hypothetical protein [Acidimicrobiales bacterium]
MALVVGGASVAQAGPATSRSASAFWVVGDAADTRVSLQATEPAGGAAGGTVFVFVTQRWCDTGADQMVFRSYSNAGAAVDARAFGVRPNLRAAGLAATVSLTGSEQRLSPCAAPTGIPTTTPLGTTAAAISAAWTGTGDTYVVQDGIVGRAATAAGSIAGIGELGTSQTAELRSTSI